MKKHDIKTLSEKELNDKLEKNYKDLMELRFKKKSGSLQNIKAMQSTKREIARIKTYLKEKQNAL